MGHTEAWKERAKQLKMETYALHLAYRDPRTPWYGRVCAALVVGYAFSPVDLIPDFVPVLGYLDDLILVPLGIVLALKMIPAQVLLDSREEAKVVLAEGEALGRTATLLIVLVWLLFAAIGIALVVRFVR
jgi:uncharacterized membrane protein YkvA (DUF1232 family)